MGFVALHCCTSNDGTLWHELKRIIIVWKAGPMGWPFTIGELIKMNQKQFYKSMPWRRARQAYIDHRVAIDGGLCEVCGVEPGLIVHHIIWLDDENCNDPEISLNENNFKYECQTCHNKEIDPRRESQGRCRYGPNGEIIRASDW